MGARAARYLDNPVNVVTHFGTSNVNVTVEHLGNRQLRMRNDDPSGVTLWCSGVDTGANPDRSPEGVWNPLNGQTSYTTFSLSFSQRVILNRVHLIEFDIDLEQVASFFPRPPDSFVRTAGAGNIRQLVDAPEGHRLVNPRFASNGNNNYSWAVWDNNMLVDQLRWTQYHPRGANAGFDFVDFTIPSYRDCYCDDCENSPMIWRDTETGEPIDNSLVVFH